VLTQSLGIGVVVGDIAWSPQINGFNFSKDQLKIFRLIDAICTHAFAICTHPRDFTHPRDYFLMKIPTPRDFTINANHIFDLRYTQIVPPT